MDTKFEQSMKVLASHTDFNANIGVVEATAFFQDNMCDYYENLKCDGVRLVKKSGVFWALTKTKIQFVEDVHWLELISMSTDIYKISPIRMDLFSTINSDGVKLNCIQELCAVDFTTRRPRMISTIDDWPKDATLKENLTGLDFDKMAFEKCEDYEESKIIVKSNDVDFFGHMNNVAYVRQMIGLVDGEFLKSIKYKKLEIHYIKECREKDELTIFYKIEDNEIKFIFEKDNETICKAKLEFCKY